MLTLADRGCVQWLTEDYRMYRGCVQGLTGDAQGMTGKAQGVTGDFHTDGFRASIVKLCASNSSQ